MWVLKFFIGIAQRWDWGSQLILEVLKVIKVLSQLQWSPLSVRRRNSRLVTFYKAVNDLSPVAVGQPRRCCHQTRSYDPLTSTPVTPRTDYYKYSFLSRTIVDWNSLPFSLWAKPWPVGWFIPCLSPAPHCLYIISLSRTPNTPAVTGHAHCWIFHRSRREQVNWQSFYAVVLWPVVNYWIPYWTVWDF